MGLSRFVVVISSYIGVPFFSAGLLFSVRKLLWRKPAVVINSEGMFDAASMFAAGMVKWEEVADIYSYQYSGNWFLGIVPKDVEGFLYRQGSMKRMFLKMNMKMGGPPIAIPQGTLPIPLGELLTKIRKFHNPN